MRRKQQKTTKYNSEKKHYFFFHTSNSTDNKIDGFAICICVAKLIYWAKNYYSLTFEVLKLYGYFYISKL